LSKEVKPIHALGFFSLSTTGVVDQFIVFDYWDPRRYYWTIFQEGLLDEELEGLKDSMQTLLDKEKVYINKEETRPIVLSVDLIFRGKRFPSILFFIRFSGKLVKGLNVYENIYESTVSEYDYEFYWMLPENASIVKVIVDGDYEVERNLLKVWVSKGTKIKGYEKIVFKLT